MPFDVERWRADAQLSRCSAATRGVWIDWLGVMWEANRSGEIIGTVDELATLGRCKEVDVTTAIADLTRTGTADITAGSNGEYQIVNRRMKRTYDERNGNATRQGRYRAGAAAVELSEDQESDFESFWAAYPKGRKKDKAVARAAFAKAIGKTEASVIIAAAAEYAASEVGTGKWVRMPSTWLNGEGWADDRAAWQDRDQARAFAMVSAAQFAELYRIGKFADGSPKRSATKPNHVYGKLRDGRQVECYDYPARTEITEKGDREPVATNDSPNG